VSIFRRKEVPAPVVEAPVRTVRVLHTREELQQAVEQAREFEWRGIAEHERRLGSYERVLHQAADDVGSGPLADVVSLEPSADAS